MILGPYHSSKHGDLEALLLLDNCTAHYVDMLQLLKGLNIFFLPPNMISNNGRCDNSGAGGGRPTT